MLVLPHADRLGVNLHQLRQRILKPPGDGGRASLPNVKLWEFLCGQLAGRIDRSPGFIYNHILYRFWNFPEQIHQNLLRLPRSRPIANRNQRNAIFVDEFFQSGFGSLYLVLRGSRVDDGRIQHLPCRVYDSQLAARAESRIPAQDYPPGNRGLHQQLFQVLAKYADRTILCLLCQFIADFTLDSRGNQPLVTVFGNLFQDGRGIWVIPGNNLFLQILQDLLRRSLYFNGKDFLRFPPVQRQDAVSSQLGQLIFKIIVHLIDGFCLRILGGGNNGACAQSLFADICTVIGFIRNHFSQNILRPCNRVFCRVHTLLTVKEGLRLCFQAPVCHLQQDKIRQWLQALLLGNRGAGTPLGAVGAV